jgi:hypothetical protein
MKKDYYPVAMDVEYSREQLAKNNIINLLFARNGQQLNRIDSLAKPIKFQYRKLYLLSMVSSSIYKKN